MYTIENGLGPKWRWLAVTFAAFAIIALSLLEMLFNLLH